MNTNNNLHDLKAHLQTKIYQVVQFRVYYADNSIQLLTFNEVYS